MNEGFASLQTSAPRLPGTMSSVNICHPDSLPGSLERPMSRGTALLVCPFTHSTSYRVILAWNSGHCCRIPSLAKDLGMLQCV